MTLTAISPMHTYTSACCSIAAVLAPYFSYRMTKVAEGQACLHIYICVALLVHTIHVRISKCQLSILHVTECMCDFAGAYPRNTVEAGKWVQGCQVHKRGGTQHFCTAGSTDQSALPGVVTEV